MTSNVPKPLGETIPSSSSQRSSLWKRLSRRGSKSQSIIQTQNPHGAIPLKSTKAQGETDNGDATSLPVKRTQRNSLIRKLKDSFRKAPSNSNQNQFQQDKEESDILVRSDDNRTSLNSRQGPGPNSPAYSTDSYVSVEVSTFIMRKSHNNCIKKPTNYFFPYYLYI